MWIVVEDFNSPSNGISGDGKCTAVFRSDHRRAKLFRFPRFNLSFTFNI